MKLLPRSLAFIFATLALVLVTSPFEQPKSDNGVKFEPAKLQANESSTKNQLATAWNWPLAPKPVVTRYFETPAHHYAAGHRGLDLAPLGDLNVYAVDNAVVKFNGMVAGRPVLALRHASGLESTYEPVISALKTGQSVQAGELIATISPDHLHNSCSTRCLHLGAKLNGEYIDPLSLLESSASVLLPN